MLCWPDSLGKVIQFAGPGFEAIQTFSAGVDDLPYNKIPQSVKIFSNAGAYSQSVSEHALALVLALSKNVGRKGDSANSYGVAGKTFVILGGGGIGSTVSKMARDGFGCRTIGVSRSFKHPENFDQTFAIDRLDNVLSTADILLCALPLNKSSRNLLNYERMSKMKRHVIIANVGRAEAINEEAISKLLIDNPDVRFGTDVFWRVNSKENFDSKLWELPNFMGTLHRAGATASPKVKEKAVDVAVANVRKYLLEGHAENLVRRDDYV